MLSIFWFSDWVDYGNTARWLASFIEVIFVSWVCTYLNGVSQVSPMKTPFFITWDRLGSQFLLILWCIFYLAFYTTCWALQVLLSRPLHSDTLLCLSVYTSSKNVSHWRAEAIIFALYPQCLSQGLIYGSGDSNWLPGFWSPVLFGQHRVNNK